MAPVRRWTMVGAPLALVIGTATLLTAALGAPLTRAQDEGDAPHPAHIHSGTCDELGDIVEPLTDVAEDTAGEKFGAAEAVLVKESETDVPLSLSDILAAPHAINIHESAEAIQNYIACGEIGGRVVDGELVIGLKEINGSGHSGVATLMSNDDSTNVMVFLAEFGAEGDAQEAAPAADTPVPAATTAPAAPADEATAEAAAETEEAPADTAPAQAAVDVPVDIRDFAFSPNPVEVPVGGTITWTNQDAVPHTATADQRDILQSGAISPGSSFSQVFDTAGEFNYFCEFHPNMTGTIIVQ
jgi:plastocyanin